MIQDLSVLKPIHRSRLLVIRALIDGYDGAIPFHQYLKFNFAKNRQYGSVDRRIYRSWCYAWFRFGKAISEENFFSRLVTGYFLVHGTDDDFSDSLVKLFFDDRLKLQFENTLQNRLTVISKVFPAFRIDDIFPLNETLSEGIDRNDFAVSMLKQPDVFIRIVKGRKEQVKMECNQHAILFKEQNDLPDCLSFESSVNLEKLPSREKGYFEIQDRSSQIAGNVVPANDGETWWDCCCGAGGKSLQLLQNFKNIRLTASDIRNSILENFASRLEKTKAGKVRLIELDIINDELPAETFDGIIADVPCSGSGTWARTPENLNFFSVSELDNYSQKQQSIISKVVKCLKPGGVLLFITCSVFSRENEDNVKWFTSLPGMRLIKQEVVLGIDKHSDSMFYAIFKCN